MAFFSIKATDSRALSTVLLEYQRKAQAIDGMLPTIAELLVGGVLDVFEAEGPGWAPLADATLAARRKAGKGAKILQDSGVMASSIAPAWGDTWAEAYAGVSYAVFHTSPEPREKIPLRDVFNLGPFENPLLDEVAALLTSNLV